jgi:hypothetical protein
LEPSYNEQHQQIRICQKNAARFVLNKPHDYKKPDSTTKMVKDLNWGKLEQRRKRSDITLMHNVVHHLIAVPVYHHPHYGRNNINSPQPCLEISDNKDKHKYI